MQYSISSLSKRLRMSQFYIFETVLTHGSISSASKTLHLSQPAVTKTIQDLEETLGQQLFIRTALGVQPTEFGLMLEQHVKKLTTDIRHLVDDLNHWNTGISGRIVIGTMLTASSDLLPRAILRLKDLAPNVAIEIKVGVNTILYPELANGEVDVMLGILPVDYSASQSLLHTPLFKETLCAVVGRENPLATQLSENWFKSQSLSWLIPPIATAAGKAVQQFFKDLDIKTPLRVIESVSIMANIAILTDSNFVALMPSSIAHRFIQLGLLNMLPLKNSVYLGEVGYTLHKDRPVTPACQRFIDTLKTLGPV